MTSVKDTQNKALLLENMRQTKGIDFSKAPSPSFVVDERLLKRNWGILKSVQDRTNCDILLALKGFSMW